MRENHRVAAIFASIFTLIQSVIWCLIAIYSVAVYACQVNYPFELNYIKTTISDLLYWSYFYGECRTLQSEELLEAPSASRTYYWMLVYGVISAIWIPTSVLLLVAVVNKIKGQYGACLYVPWIINTAVIIVLDFCATVVYGLDISHTLTVQDYVAFIRPLPRTLVGADGITVVPAIEMTVYFSRIIVFWLLNFILLGVVIQACVALKRMAPTSAFVEREVRTKATSDSNSSQWINVRSDNMNLKHLPRLQIEDSPERTRTSSESNSETPSTAPVPLTPKLLPRETSLKRSNSSPVYDVYGKHLGNDFPEEIPKRTPTYEIALKSGLKNQMPWTYAQPVELNLRIKQAAMQQKEAGRPEIPNPDYTMHFQQRKRPGLPVSNLSRSTSLITSSSDSPYPGRNWSRSGEY
uniref:Putative nucleoside transporter n=1 Tax=Panstrongylus lignarius TaxID=156445 RepID=A0A224XPI2_9HEMI